MSNKMETTRRGILGLFGALPFVGRGAAEKLSKNIIGFPSMPLSEAISKDSELCDDISDPMTSGTNPYYRRQWNSIRQLFGLTKGTTMPAWKATELRLNARNSVRFLHIKVPSVDTLKSVSAVHKERMREQFLIEEAAYNELVQAKASMDKERWEEKHNDDYRLNKLKKLPTRATAESRSSTRLY